MKKMIFTILLIAGSQKALADQCAVVSATQANRAIEVLESNPYVVQYCENCDDNSARLHKLDDIRAKVFSNRIDLVAGLVKIGVLKAYFAALNVTTDFFIADVYGRPIDLAYVYVKARNNAMVNLGSALGCRNSSPVFLPEAQSAEVLLRILLGTN
jgi:hypothetical protein